MAAAVLLPIPTSRGLLLPTTSADRSRRSRCSGSCCIDATSPRRQPVSIRKRTSAALRRDTKSPPTQLPSSCPNSSRLKVGGGCSSSFWGLDPLHRRARDLVLGDRPVEEATQEPVGAWRPCAVPSPPATGGRGIPGRLLLRPPPAVVRYRCGTCGHRTRPVRSGTRGPSARSPLRPRGPVGSCPGTVPTPGARALPR